MKAKIKRMAPRMISELLTILAIAATISISESWMGTESYREMMYLGMGAYAYQPIRKRLQAFLAKRIK